MANTTLESIDVRTLISEVNASLEIVSLEANGLAAIPAEEADDRWSAIIREVVGFHDLADDWDGLGAKAPSAALVDSALLLADLLRQGGMKAPGRVVPGLEGEVIFEWQRKGVYLEVEVCKPSYAEYVKIAPGQQSVHRVLAY